MAPLPLPLPATPYPPKPHESPRPAPLHAALASLSQQGSDHGSLRDAFALVSRAERQSSPGAAVAVGPEVYVSLLQCCVAAGSLPAGRQVHAAAVKRGPYYCRHAYIGTKLAVFYARCGALADAERVFDALPKKNAFAWAAVIGLWSRAGLHARALDGYIDMLQAGVPADNFVVPSVLKSCAGIGMVGTGRALHGYAWKAGFMECVYVLSSLVDFYGKCGVVDDAREVFDAMTETTVVTWNSMLMAYINNGRIDDAVELFYQMRVEGVLPTRASVLSLLSASADFEALDWGRQGHAVAVSSGLAMDVIWGSSIINFYCKVGLVEAAEAVFEQMVERDAVTWNLMISGYLQDGQTDKALITCRKMLQSGLRFDCVTLASIIMACMTSCGMEMGRVAHGYAVRNNLESDQAVACGLIELYMSSERTEHARRLFDVMSCRDMVMWRVMISAYADRGMSSQALKVLYQMQHEGISPSAACWDSVISAFMKNEQIDEALEIFNEMLITKTRPNLRTWSLLISGLSRNGMHCEVMNLCCKMQEVEPAPSPTIFSAALVAMKAAASVQYGKAMHACIVKKGLLLSKSVMQSLLNMYGSFSDRTTVESLLGLLAAAQ
ncbi:pentatricopeptide repeat-containing protein At5g55740, chloroplastic-like [Triticum dicoccoides]|uniref:pentatricopeptide repeat-containing protein At5g55740, chloroplastic-like n=1 Tax=Triticum dicoccoides TaxID=85692 RepID=UPI0018909235|nr:pentatricopeptide repeat-containing protein At5g55740, chloroplastic-like [Triticum dicoccoides]